jgi:group II intron reverse transcriptase/maturase
MVLEPLYEQEFLECSYGFRPGRSAHDAVRSLWEQLTSIGGGWIIDLDIRKFFDTMDHACLRGILKKRVCDGVILRLIGKWLKAGVLDKGNVTFPARGTPQGGVISPMLSNIYLHEVLDKWVHIVVKPRLKGKTFLIRYADDAILGFSCEEDALRVMEVLSKRFGKYGLTIHPEKTRVVRFNKPKMKHDTERSDPRRETFNFLGFTHYWGLSRKGRWVIKRRTEKNRFSRSLKRVAQWCKRNRHLALQVQFEHLQKKLRGHYAYYGITGNMRSLENFQYQVRRVWRKWLNRRSRKRSMTWEKFNQVLKRYPLSQPKIVHSCYAAKL